MSPPKALDEIRKRLEAEKQKLLSWRREPTHLGVEEGIDIGFDAAVALLFPAVEALEWYSERSSYDLAEDGGERASQALDRLAKGDEK